MNHFVSIIMPAFNAENRIVETVHSLQRQVYQDYELIIIDDGSTDKTGLLCDSLAEQCSKIRVLHENNAGPGKAREKGIEVAKGDIIAFLDSDDYLSEDALQIIALKMDETDADIIQFGYKMVDSNGKLIKEHPLTECVFESRQDAYKYFITQNNSTNYLWNKVYKHALFQNIEWPGIFYSEDYAVLAQLYAKASKSVTIADLLYCYVQHEESAVNKPFSKRKMDQITAGEFVVEFTRKHFPDYLPEALYYLATRAARLSESSIKSDLKDKQEIYTSTVLSFKSAYSEMIKVLKLQKRTLKLDKTTKVFAFSPKLALWLKRLI